MCCACRMPQLTAYYTLPANTHVCVCVCVCACMRACMHACVHVFNGALILCVHVFVRVFDGGLTI